MGDFVHLHLHSEYSLLDGACRIADIPAAAAAAGHKAVAITDHGVLYGAVAFYDACLEKGIRPIIGCEVYVAPRGRFRKEGKADQSGHHLILLAENEEGYRNLCRMVSRSFTEGFYSRPRVDLELLEQYHGGLIALSGCIGGTVPQLILAGDMTEAENYARKLLEIFGDGNFYLEIQDHGIPEERTVREGIARISAVTGIPMVATGDVHYIRKEDAETQAILMCVQTGTTVSDGRPLGFSTDEFYYKSTEEMERLFAAYPGACENTVKIAERCHFDFTFGNITLPKFRVPEGTPETFLRRLTEEGFCRKVKEGLIDLSAFPEAVYRERLEYELGVICKMGFDEYYLIVQDFVAFAKRSGIPVGPGRGSGAGSLVAYCVDITTVDPIRYGLLFERFLNPERVSMPDFDIDFCYDRREEVIAYVKERYGADHVAQIVTFGTLAAKAAVRDVGRALGMSYADTDAVAKLIPHEMNVTIRDALQNKELKELYDRSEQVRKLLDISMALEGMPRHASTHAAGVVITEKPTCEYVPLSGTGDGIVTEFDMDTIARLGLVKFDFLGLRYLTILAEAEADVRETRQDFSLETIPMDDKATYEMISSGETTGLFQLESGGMRQMLMQLRPSTIGEITAAIALYRPGPMDSIPRFIACKFGREQVAYKTPLLREILGETYGCIVYQEQVMQIFRRLAGYSLARADTVRRAMAKKKMSVLAAEEEDFVRGCAERGVGEEAARAIFDDMVDFAKYAFNKSHAAAYAVLSYRTAYLMRHHTAAYLAALMTSVLGDAGKLGEYIAVAQKKGIPVLPPDINESRVTFTVCDGGIRFGLLALKNVGLPFLQSILRERTERGPFVSFGDFLTRMSGGELNRRQVESLIKSGAFDRLGVFRSQLLSSFEEQIGTVTSRSRANVTGQLDLFSVMQPDNAAAPSFPYPDIPEFSPRELLALEKESSGMYFSGHLLDEYSEAIAQAGCVSIRDILRAFSEEESDPEYEDGQSLKIAGILTRKSVKTTRNGTQMAFLTLEDRIGEMEVVVFPKLFDSVAGELTQDAALLVSGKLSVREEEGVKLLADRVLPLAAGRELSRRYRLVLRIPSISGEVGSAVLTLLRRYPGDVPVLLYEESTGKYHRPKNLCVNGDTALTDELARMLGKSNVVTQTV